jgi:hypothetical protein
MDGGSSEGSEARFAAYVEALSAVLGHADRQQPMQDDCVGLLMPIARKSVEPLAAVTAPAQVPRSINRCFILLATQGYRPRGAADPTPTAHPQLDRHGAQTAHRRARQNPPEMPLLQCAGPQMATIPDY